MEKGILRRPIVAITCAYIFGIVFACLLTINIGLAIAIILGVMAYLLCIFLSKRYKLSFGSLCILFFIFLLGMYLYGLSEAKLKAEGEWFCTQEEINGLIISADKKADDHHRFEVKTSEGKVLVNVYGEIDDMLVYEGREAYFKGKVSLPQQRRNPHCFDYRQYLKSKKISAVMSVYATKDTKNEIDKSKKANALRQKVSGIGWQAGTLPTSLERANNEAKLKNLNSYARSLLVKNNNPLNKGWEREYNVFSYGERLEKNNKSSNIELFRYNNRSFNMKRVRKNESAFNVERLGNYNKFSKNDREIYNFGSFVVYEVKRPITNKLSGVRIGFLSKIREERGEELASLIAGILFGDKTGIDEDLYERFQRVGSAHVLAVSGLHIGLVYALCEKLLGRRRTTGAEMAKALAVVCYALMAGLSPSVCRATCMILLCIAANALAVRYDITASACACALGSLVLNPCVIYNTGFLLSYLAIITIAVFNSRLRHLKDSVLLAPASVQVGLAPLICYSFNTFSFVALFANIPVLFIAGILVPAGMLTLIVSLLPATPIFEFLQGTGMSLLDLLAGALLYLNDLAYAGGRAFTFCKSPALWQLFLYYALVFSIMSETGFILIKRKKKKIIALSLACIMVFTGFVGIKSSTPFDKAQMTFVDVGQGDCLHIKTPDGKNILIDGGGSTTYNVGKKTLLPYLLKNGVDKIDLAIITHLHKDHYGGIAELSKFIEIEKIGIYEGYMYAEESLKEFFPDFEGEYLYLNDTSRVSPCKDVTLDILYPEKCTRDQYLKKLENVKDENAISLIVRVDYDGVSVLMSADIDATCERELCRIYDNSNTVLSNYRNETARHSKDTKSQEPSNDSPITNNTSITSDSKLDQSKTTNPLEADILKVPHHGSKYSSSDELINAVSPKVALIQCGKNNFGHPSESVIEKYQDFGIMVYRTDKCGAVCIYDINNGEARLDSMINDLL